MESRKKIKDMRGEKNREGGGSAGSSIRSGQKASEGKDELGCKSSMVGKEQKGGKWGGVSAGLPRG